MGDLLKQAKEDYRHPRCWASSRGFCDTKISLEHYISDAVLKVLKAETVVAPSYTGGTVGVPIKRRNFGANVLCCRHNSELSPLDSSAQLLFTAQRLFAAEVNEPNFNPQDEQVNVSGDELERWVLKTLVTHTVAEIFTAGGSTINRPDLDRVADLVYEDTSWPARWGLWMKHRPDLVLNLKPAEFEPFWMVDGQKLGGGRVMLGGIEFRLSLFSPADGDGGPFDGAVFRPSGIVYQFANFKKVIGFRWADGSANTSISYEVKASSEDL
jgi:hypothetical protein